MLLNIEWAVPGRLLLVNYKGLVSYRDFQKTSEDILQKLDHVRHGKAVHIIGDLTRREGYDIASLKLYKMREVIVPVVQHHQIGWVVMIVPKPNPVMSFLVDTVRQITPFKYRVCKTMPDALDFLKHQDLRLFPPVVQREESEADTSPPLA